MKQYYIVLRIRFTFNLRLRVVKNSRKVFSDFVGYVGNEYTGCLVSSGTIQQKNILRKIESKGEKDFH